MSEKYGRLGLSLNKAHYDMEIMFLSSLLHLTAVRIRNKVSNTCKDVKIEVVKVRDSVLEEKISQS